MKSLENISLADAEAVNGELKGEISIQKRGKFTLNIPSRITAEFGKCALCNGTQTAKKRFSSKYSQHEFKRSTVKNWKKKFRKMWSQEKANSPKLEDPIKLTMK